MVYKLNQNQTPLFDALKKYYLDGTVSFHVPGHKQGNGIPEFRDFVGTNVLGIDATIMADLDSICSPTGVIRQAELLTADAYGVDDAHFLVNGTTSGIQAMIVAVCRPGDKIIVPRNAHQSVIGGLILSGASPVYIEPVIDQELGIAMGITVDAVRRAISQHPDAKAIFVINPTYYGMASPLEEIVRIAHAHGLAVLVDEAHGAHFHFHPNLPVSAAQAGADLAAVSAHKTLGSMTQSSFLLVNERFVSSQHVKSVMNLTQTTSPSYVLMASLDVARKQAALRGHSLLEQVLELTTAARTTLNDLDGLYVFGPDKIGQPGCHAYDNTKLAIHVRGLNITGHEVNCLLRERYGIQVELSDIYNVLAIGAIGDTQASFDRLVAALQGIAAEHHGGVRSSTEIRLPEFPPLEYLPREAFYSEQDIVPLEEAEGRISAETIMAYPPGIPIIVPGERFTADVIAYIRELKARRSPLQGTKDKTMSRVSVVRKGSVATLVIPHENLLIAAKM